ncbi:MAG: nucleotide exchange factor GrpE [Thermoplasmata archaeon]
MSQNDPKNSPPEPPVESEATDAPSSAASVATEEEPEGDWATRYKYLQADFENFRRRTEREKENASRQTRARLLQELLPIYEAFHYARDAVERLPPQDPLRQGLDLLHREWQRFLKHEGVEPVASPGEPFLPEVHEAVGEVPVSEGHLEGTLVEVVQQGYRFFGGLLRPAKVIVARGGSSQADAAPKESS